MPLWPSCKAYPRSHAHILLPVPLLHDLGKDHTLLTLLSVDFSICCDQIPATYQCLGPEHGFQKCPFLMSLQPGSLKITYTQGFLNTNFYLKSYTFSLANKAGTHGLQGRILKQKKTSWHQGNISRMFQSWLTLI